MFRLHTVHVFGSDEQREVSGVWFLSAFINEPTHRVVLSIRQAMAEELRNHLCRGVLDMDFCIGLKRTGDLLCEVTKKEQ